MEETHKPFWRRCETTPRDRRNQRRIIGWGFVWMAAWLAVNFAIRFDHLTSALGVATAAAVPAVLGVLTVLAYRRFLREADELRRKIEVEALALSAGVGLVCGFTYFLLERAALVSESGLLVILMVITFTHALGVFLGMRRYA
jgi:drug/metabolite transporter (DMT)-like permease